MEEKDGKGQSYQYREGGREGGECRERPTILDRIKWNSHIPCQNNDEGTKEQKRAILASLKWGGVVQMFHLFCPRLGLEY